MMSMRKILLRIVLGWWLLPLSLTLWCGVTYLIYGKDEAKDMAKDIIELLWHGKEKIMNDNRTFWLVWNSKTIGCNPQVKHCTEESAVAEAERLALRFPESTFVVLRAVKARWVDNMNRMTYDQGMPEPPF